MRLLDHLRGMRSEIESRWCEVILSSYPTESSRFYASERDPFRNPVGATVRSSVATLFEAVLTGEWTEDSKAALVAIVKLRSIQDMRASHAVDFASRLRSVIHESVRPEDGSVEGDLGLLDERIEGLRQRSFDEYVACRDKLHELRERETKARLYSLLRRAGMLAEPEEGGADGEPGGGSSV
jgi:hypothetical protein